MLTCSAMLRTVPLAGMPARVSCRDAGAQVYAHLGARGGSTDYDGESGASDLSREGTRTRDRDPGASPW